eukprot:CAMPEP_0117651108 /NCGR_PEP_ID=MMETSP0804-20121206/1913_1 /TAXON_ID=1074897 /ORGANISM="Tetraselmis astigmatica, Strain CCMP880" /LENGTH=199 /DNA_ID=CAMNT_0005457057 /DNA_START=196 /DNA_END=791 /DNA_ORIENTATION=+
MKVELEESAGVWGRHQLNGFASCMLAMVGGGELQSDLDEAVAYARRKAEELRQCKTDASAARQTLIRAMAELQRVKAAQERLRMSVMDVPQTPMDVSEVGSLAEWNTIAQLDLETTGGKNDMEEVKQNAKILHMGLALLHQSTEEMFSHSHQGVERSDTQAQLDLFKAKVEILEAKLQEADEAAGDMLRQIGEEMADGP